MRKSFVKSLLKGTATPNRYGIKHRRLPVEFDMQIAAISDTLFGGVLKLVSIYSL